MFREPVNPPMKTKLLLALAALTLAPLGAETLPADAAVFAAADPKSAVIVRLKAGAAITPAAGEAPAGWRLVEISGPFDAFVRNRDINKGLEVREGANIHVQPKADSPVLTVATADDVTEVTGLAGGDWCQIKLEKKLTGYIAIGQAANAPAASAPATAPAPALLLPPTPAFNTPGRPAPMSGTTAELPRAFQGTLLPAARALLNPNPPYDYHLVDASGKRLAYVDLQKIILNARVESVLSRPVTVIGTFRSTVDGKDLVITAESIQPR